MRRAEVLAGAVLQLVLAACAGETNALANEESEQRTELSSGDAGPSGSRCIAPIDCVDPEVREYLEWRFYEGPLTFPVDAASGAPEATLRVTYLARMRVGPLERANRRVGLYYGATSVVGVSESTPGCSAISDLASTDAEDVEVAFLRLSDDLLVEGSLEVCGTTAIDGTVTAEAVELRVGYEELQRVDAKVSTQRTGGESDELCADAGATCSLAATTARLERVPRPPPDSPYTFGADDPVSGY